LVNIVTINIFPKESLNFNTLLSAHWYTAVAKFRF